MITKKEIINLLRQFKEGTPFNWRICHCAALLKDEGIDIAIDYIGQGMAGDIYNGNYKKYIDIKEEFLSYRGLGGECNLNEATDKIYEVIKESIS